MMSNLKKEVSRTAMETISEKSKSIVPYDFQTRKVQPYDEELIQKLRIVYEGGLPASILLLWHGMSNGHCNDRALLIAEALQDGNIQLVYATIDGIRLNPKVEQDNPMYADHCFIERTTKDGRHLIYDTSMGLIIDKSLYWLLEHPKVRKINSKAEIAKVLDTEKNHLKMMMSILQLSFYQF